MYNQVILCYVSKETFLVLRIYIVQTDALSSIGEHHS
uniref:Uncharacterized protein n=1 Tax=Lepeophtheirus salmonis TaxID=72036 RepID=A0A0K2V1K4_LEPSM